MASLGKADLLARWGGDEWVVMLPRATAQEAWSLAEKLRLSMAVHVFPVVPKVTGSFAVAELQMQEKAEHLFDRMDSVLQAAKAAGGNLVKLSE